MDYTLAKELKDAGFPQSTHSRGFGVFPSGEVINASFLSEKYDAVYVPTLEELIEACGQKLVSISRMFNGRWLDGWGALYHGSELSSAHSLVEGATPTEAVARLWLALKRHHTLPTLEGLIDIPVPDACKGEVSEATASECDCKDYDGELGKGHTMKCVFGKRDLT